jgi:hypothetical protein
MAEAQERTQFDSLVPWTGSFLNLDKPRTITAASREVPKFSGNFETEKGGPEEQRIRAAIVAEARKKWPNLDVGAAIRSGELLVPISDGDKLADKAKLENETAGHKNYGKNRLREWSRGKTILIARSKDEYPPTVTIRENGVSTELETLDAVGRAKGKYLYTGSQVLFGVRLNAYDGVGATGKPGVNAYLEAVESLGYGEKLIAAKDRTERFKGYIGLAKNEDPTGAAASGTDW